MKLKILLYAIFCITGCLFAEEIPDIFNKLPKKELTARARTVLLEALTNKDSEKAHTAFGYLQANIKNGAPLSLSEEYMIYFELGEYENGIRAYEKHVLSQKDGTYSNEQDHRIHAHDKLTYFLDAKWSRYYTKNGKIFKDSLINEVNNSGINQEYKDLYPMLIQIDEIYLSWIQSDGLHDSSESAKIHKYQDQATIYCSKYPTTNTARYLKEQVIPTIDKILKDEETRRQDPFFDRYYTGGFSIYAGKWYGFLSGEITEYIKDKMDNTLMFEGEIQVRRIAISAIYSMGMITNPKYDTTSWTNENDGNFSMTLGYVVYDSRFLKTTPFAGVGTTFFETKENLVEPLWILGMNIDSRLLFTKPPKRGTSFGINARFKYMMQIGEFDSSNDHNFNKKDPSIEATMINHTFALELGVLIW